MVLRHLALLALFLCSGIGAEDPWSISRAHPVTDETLHEKHEHTKADSNPLIRFYQNYISPLSGSTCHYAPTCSRYTAEAIRKFGMFKGIIMGTDRLIRCHPGQREYPLDPPKDY
ncbi:MAG: membrane protein insertion efficiency factor YidD [Spirochaetes bacterium]|nr:membrane protein insertion efficiency factor YidD [Spirochaetota bacterium]MBX3722217.1 membrane protein insertion efficiency factor YidD [Turneriella sp.]